MSVERPLRIPSGEVHLLASLRLPPEAKTVVIFAHGSGSGRNSPRNRSVAEEFDRAGIGAVLMDLLAEPEARDDERTSGYRFRIPLLGARLVDAVDFVAGLADTQGLGIGLFGASTGGAAAMVAAARRPALVSALVLRGARSDLADEVAPKVRAPTLFVVGALDPAIARANRVTAGKLGGVHDFEIVAGASHLFEEPGALSAVARSSIGWFRRFGQKPAG